MIRVMGWDWPHDLLGRPPLRQEAKRGNAVSAAPNCQTKAVDNPQVLTENPISHSPPETMRKSFVLSVISLVATGMFLFPCPADAAVRVGSGDSSLLGGDLTDPSDKITPVEDCGGDLPEDKLKPENCAWVSMQCAPANPPGTPPHQRHPYQSWQGSPASAIFWNKPESKKWYVGFKDGGNGGPTTAAPYFAAVELKEPVTLTHFTLTTSSDMPDRDPKSWVIQGSNTGRDDDWTDIFKCEAKDRDTSPFQEYPRNETTLFTSFTSADMAQLVSATDLKKLETKLAGKPVPTADFAAPKAYKWYRFVCYSCFNPNTTEIADPARPPGFSLGQMELFGVPAKGN